MRALIVGTLAAGLVLPSALGAQSEPVMPSTLAAGLLARFDESTTKLLQLARAIPADKYDWSPTAGVRTVRHVLVHTAMGNYYTAEDAGVPRPTDLPRDPERVIAGKDTVIAFVERSKQHLRAALERLNDADLQRPTTMFGQKTTYGNVYLFGIGHVHEHLGQLIAYARSAGIVPPWSTAH